MDRLPGYPDNLFSRTVTIASGAAVSEMIPSEGMAVVAIVPPAAWTAANLAVAACITGNVNDLAQVLDSGGNPEKTAVTAGKPIAMPFADAVYMPWLQLLSVSTTDNTTPVNQAADRTIKILFRKFLS